jgi:hypothetical protein
MEVQPRQKKIKKVIFLNDNKYPTKMIFVSIFTFLNGARDLKPGLVN